MQTKLRKPVFLSFKKKKKTQNSTYIILKNELKFSVMKDKSVE